MQRMLVCPRREQMIPRVWAHGNHVLPTAGLYPLYPSLGQHSHFPSARFNSADSYERGNSLLQVRKRVTTNSHNNLLLFSSFRAKFFATRLSLQAKTSASRATGIFSK